MELIKWCLNVKNGLELIEPNLNMSNSYIKMAEESLSDLDKVESRIWKGSILYYLIYYSIYSVMMKLGIKCEIHKCSIEFMKEFLIDFYNEKDVELVFTSFELRSDLQYYPSNEINQEKFEFVKNNVVDFFIKTKKILSQINQDKIKEIRNKLEKMKNDE